MTEPLDTIQHHVDAFNTTAQLAALSLRVSARHTDTWTTLTLTADGFAPLTYVGSPAHMTQLVMALTHLLLIADFETSHRT